jgi:hypothetical protein
MKQELGGWRVQYTPTLRRILEEQDSPHSRKIPDSLATVSAKGRLDWDLVSLEDSDVSSLDVRVFPHLKDSQPTPLSLDLIPEPLLKIITDVDEFKENSHATEKQLVLVDQDVISSTDIPTEETPEDIASPSPLTVSIEEGLPMQEVLPQYQSGIEDVNFTSSESEDSATLCETPIMSSHSCESPLTSLAMESDISPLTTEPIEPKSFPSKAKLYQSSESCIRLGIAFDSISNDSRLPKAEFKSSRTSRRCQKKCEAKPTLKKIQKLPHSTTPLVRRLPKSKDSTSKGPTEQTRRLPVRHARVGSDYSKRDAFLGTWPSRNQSASRGTWKL